MAETLQFKDISGNQHHYNVSKVIDVKQNSNGQCWVVIDSDKGLGFEINTDEYTRLTGTAPMEQSNGETGTSGKGKDA